MLDLTKQYQTRDGKRKTLHLFHCPENDASERIVAIFDNGTSDVFFENGNFVPTSAVDEDLVPIPAPQIDWQAVARGEQKVRNKIKGINGTDAKAVLVSGSGAIAVEYPDGSLQTYLVEHLDRFELIPPPEPEMNRTWFNLHASGLLFRYASRSAADMYAAADRIECREITWPKTVPAKSMAADSERGLSD